VNLDTEFDAEAGIAGLCAKLDVYIGSAEAARAEEKKRALSTATPQPVFGRSVATGIVPAAGPLILGFPLRGPDQGHYWMVRQVSVGGLAVGVVAAGTADLFISSSDLRAQPSLAAMGLGDWRDHFAAMPTITQYGSGNMPLRFNEEIFVVVTGGTVGQQYVAAVSFIDFREGPTPQDWSI
jgi:hypothetical protein